ncbi:thioesterase II family protein [Streptomyces sp. OE57]|uniref:thioesterase II family protein n=1 Tax=Streptomyces lacaronensis TaxID=3379885 RepID=UPI0039B7751A
MEHVGAAEVRPGRWLRRFRRGESPQDVRLICFPHAGGAATFFFPFARGLNVSAEVLAVQYPGRQDRHRDACIDSVEEMADLIFEDVRVLDDRPLAFFGHSMGAVLAFEVTRRLEEKDGISPRWLFASARPAPSRHRDEKLRTDDAQLIADLKALNGPNSGIFADEDALRVILPAIRSDYKAIEGYVVTPDTRVTCPISTVIGVSDERVTSDEAEDWGKHTTGDFELMVFPGGHFYLTEQLPDVARFVAERISQ